MAGPKAGVSGSAKDTEKDKQTTLSSFFSRAPAASTSSSSSTRTGTGKQAAAAASKDQVKRALSKKESAITISSDGEEDGMDEPVKKKVKVDEGSQQQSSFFSPASKAQSTSKLEVSFKPQRSSVSRLSALAFSTSNASGSTSESSSTSHLHRRASEASQARKAAFAAVLTERKRHSSRGEETGYLSKESVMAAQRSPEGPNTKKGGKATAASEEEDGMELDDDFERGMDDEESNAGRSSKSGRFDKFAAAPVASTSGKSKGKGKGKVAPETEPESEPEPAMKKKKKGGKAKGKAKEDEPVDGAKYTPLEKQIVKLKAENPGVLLIVEVGYKLRFFGSDARAASAALNIACFPSHSFLTASGPVHRLQNYLTRLLAAGHKVGVVRQMETAALKKAEGKAGTFERKLVGVWSQATWVESMDGADSVVGGPAAGGGTPCICVVLEEGKLANRGRTADSKDGKKKLGLIAVVPSTGEVVYDEFEDTHLRNELETRLLHLQPSELLLPPSLSKQSEGLLAHYAGAAERACRIERIEKVMRVEEANSLLIDFYANKEEERGKKKKKEVIEIDSDSEAEGSSSKFKGGVSSVFSLPSLVLPALAALIKHLTAYSLTSLFDRPATFRPFSSRAHLTLAANTLSNLEILQNQTDGEVRGSLWGLVDKTKTGMGKRELRRWITRPLLDLGAINARLDAVTELGGAEASDTATRLAALLRDMPDLERGLVRIHFAKSSPQELVKVLESFVRVANDFHPNAEQLSEVSSALLKEAFDVLPSGGPPAANWLSKINVKAAKKGEKVDMWQDDDLFPRMNECKASLDEVKAALRLELKDARKVLKKPGLEFTTVAQEEYLLEVPVADSKRLVPNDWIRINSTKAQNRYRTPKVQKKMEELAQWQERLEAEANLSFDEFLKMVAGDFAALRLVVSALATCDCLLSLAAVALLPGYSRPTFTEEEGHLEIVGGRHPMVEQINADPFVPNDVSLGGDSQRAMILLGPNAGGKSSLSRATALIAILAQVGSYVPADSVTTSLFDGIYTRMGASDDLARGRSTFMLEMLETSEILKMATPRSLVVLDELGRGTSTNDGQAVAAAVLQHIVTKLKPLTVFVTHYPSLSSLEKQYPDHVKCWHMSYVEIEQAQHEDVDNPDKETSVIPEIVFLFKLKPGLALKSHGLNVARIAGLPQAVLDKAYLKARELEAQVDTRLAANFERRAGDFLRELAGADAAGSADDQSALIATANELAYRS